MYYKTINDRMVFSDGKTILTNDGVWISNPTAEQIADAGWQVYVPPVVPPQPQTEPYEADIVEAVKKMLAPSTEELSDEDALDVAALFPTWKSKLDEGKEVPAGERLWYDGKLYKVIQAHTPQADWTPDTAVSLYVEVSIAEIPDWVQPISAETAYHLGDKVSHNDKVWESTEDPNTWEPGIYGWKEV